MIKSKAIWGLVSLVAASLPTAAFAQPKPNLNPYIKIDYNEQTLAQETIYGTSYVGQKLRVPVNPINGTPRKSFEFPISLSVKKDSSIATSTPITDRYKIHQFGDCNGDNEITFEDLQIHRGICNSRFKAWAGEVESVARSGGPVLINDRTGNPIEVYDKDGKQAAYTVVLNGSGKLVANGFVNKPTPVSMDRQCRDVAVQQRPFLAPAAVPQEPIRGLW